MNKRVIELIGIIIFWATTSWFIVQSFSITGIDEVEVNGKLSTKVTHSNELKVKLIVVVGVCMALFIACYIFLKQALVSQKKSRFFLLTLVSFFLAIAIEWIIFFATGSYNEISIVLTVGLTLFYYISILMYAMTKIVIQNDKINSTLLIEKKKSELALLRSQLQPHFLFNALNNLLSMVDQRKSPQLALAIQKLSQLLRYVIEESKHDKVSISKEIDFIKSFIELHQLKYAEGEVKVNLKIAGSYDDQLVEPGIFISLVENAFKHGTEPETKSVISINFDLNSNDRINFEIENAKKNFQSIGSTGTGLRELKERLEVIYNGKHILQIDEGQTYKVNLILMTQ